MRSRISKGEWRWMRTMMKTRGLLEMRLTRPTVLPRRLAV